MKKALVAAAAVVALASPVPSFAQFGGIGNIGGMLGNVLGGKPSGGNAGADMGARQDQLVKTYMAAGRDVLTANGHMAEALGIQAAAINATATADSMSGNDLEAQDKAISESSAAIAQAQQAGATLNDAQAKAKYAQGLTTLAMGVKKYFDMSQAAQGFISGMSSASPLMLAKLQSGVYVARNLPGSVANLGSTLKSAMDFARKNGVEVPKDAEDINSRL